ncbi:MAG TPA: TonB-dependent receptor [Chromatiaceae bacterium]|nr:TonB-dependent receptor [Chromatiaceae bacterium]
MGQLENITAGEVSRAQEIWGAGIVAIGKAHTDGGDYVKAAEEHLDNLYAFDDVKIKPTGAVKPEKTDTVDLGLRYTTALIQAQVAGWYTYYDNRIISTTTELEGGGTLTTDRNVGAHHDTPVEISSMRSPPGMMQIMWHQPRAPRGSPGSLTSPRAAGCNPEGKARLPQTAGIQARERCKGRQHH